MAHELVAPTTVTTTAGLGPSLVRTLVPLIVGPLAAYFGFNPDDPIALLALSSGIGYLYYVLVRTCELKFPTLGYLLGIAKQPTYSPKNQVSPAAGEALQVAVVDVTVDPVAPVVPVASVTPDVVTETPVQTDNRPRPEDPAPLPAPDATTTFSGEMR